MGKSTLFVLGLLIVGAAAGGFYYRVAADPEAASRRYNWVLEQMGVDSGPKEAQLERPAPAPGNDEAAGRTRSLSPDALQDRRSARVEKRQQREQLELFKLGLDFMNLVVGLVGIWLALRSYGSSQRQS